MDQEPLESLERAGKRARFFSENKPQVNVYKQDLEAILGPLSPDAYNSLANEPNLETAVNKYLSRDEVPQHGGTTNSENGGTTSEHNNTTSKHNGTTSKHNGTTSEHNTETLKHNTFETFSSTPLVPKIESPSLIKPESLNGIPDIPDQWKTRYIGCFQATAWTTRPGTNLVEYDEKLVVKRNPLQSKKETVVRLYNSENVDIARVSQQDANFMATLMDAQMCEFSAVCIYIEPRVSTGDSLIIQMNCYMLPTAFEDHQPISPQYLGRESLPRFKVGMAATQSSLVTLFIKVGVLTEDSGLLRAQEAVTQKQEEQEVSKEDLDILYQESSKAELPEAEPGDNFKLDLFAYQKQGLYWMVQRESDKVCHENVSFDPIWSKFEWPNSDQVFYWNKNCGDLRLKAPERERPYLGGVLADEMGLGKTISTMALIHTSEPITKTNITLVVCPLSLVSQWESEALKASKSNTCHVFVYYGVPPAKLREFKQEIFSGPKIVVTSYDRLVSDFRQRATLGDNIPLGFYDIYCMMFERVVLDEAHIIRNRATFYARSCYQLRSMKRWALTGTPVVNRLEDLHSLVTYLKVTPWSEVEYWNSFITKPFETGQAQQALSVARTIVAPLVLRRTKAMKHNGKPLVDLPAKTVILKEVEFSKRERDLYGFAYASVRNTVVQHLREGNRKSILALVTRLRQLCCHPRLIMKESPSSEPSIPMDPQQLERLLGYFEKTPSSSVEESWGVSAAEVLSSETAECPICSECKPVPQRALTSCLHMACLDCITEYIEFFNDKGESPRCFICRSAISADSLYVANRTAFGTLKVKQYIGSRQSAKTRALMAELHKYPLNGKHVVFSAFVSFLDIIEQELNAQGMRTVKFTGSLSKDARSAAQEFFKTTKEPCVMLVSMKAGGVGLNLVSAQQVFLMETWWNNAGEMQAIDRIHRMGQTCDVRVVRFVVKNSIEERMLRIQERKQVLSRVVSGSGSNSEDDQLNVLLDLGDWSKSVLES